MNKYELETIPSGSTHARDVVWRLSLIRRTGHSAQLGSEPELQCLHLTCLSRCNTSVIHNSLFQMMLFFTHSQDKSVHMKITLSFY